MNDALVKTAAALLVATGAAAEANLLRVWIAGWREARRSRQRRWLCARSTGSAPRPPALGTWVAAASLLILVPSAALAQSSEALAAQPVPSASPSILPAPTSSASPLTLSTDRPSFSDGTGIQPVWHLNIETGYTFTHRDRDNVETDRHNGPEMLGRLGLIEDRLEFRVIWSGYVTADTDSGGTSSSANGLSDVTLGFKLKLFDQGQLADWAPRLALGAQTTIGAGGAEVSTQEEEPALKLLWSYDLRACWGEKWTGWSTGGNFNIAWPTSGEGTDHFEQFQASLYVNAPLFDKCTGFAEYYVLTPNSDGGDTAHYADFGAVYLLSPRVQLDARVGFGLNNEADNFFAGIGLSFLF